MAALSTIALVVGAAAAVGSYATSVKGQKRQAQAADEAKIAAAADVQANNQAATSAAARDQAAAAAKANADLAAEQLATTPEVTIDPAENAGVRKRVVKAQFNVADGGASSSAGSIRV